MCVVGPYLRHSVYMNVCICIYIYPLIADIFVQYICILYICTSCNVCIYLCVYSSCNVTPLMRKHKKCLNPIFICFDLKQCGVFQYGKMFLLGLIMVVSECCVRPQVMYSNHVW